MSSAELERLFQALEGRDAGLSRDDVARDLESTKTKTDVEQWVQEYLFPETLLTREELNFSQSRPSKATLEHQIVHYVSDDSLELAINSLEARTAAVEKQCRLLEAQKQAIEEIIRRNAFAPETVVSKTPRSSKSAHEKARIELEQSELSASLRAQLDAASKQAEAMIGSMPSSIEKTLDKDDRLLDGLERMLPELSFADGSSANGKEVDRLCKALVAQMSADVRSQIDASFEQSARTNAAYTNGNHAKGDSQDALRQREALQSELDELCREIDSLSTMVVECQYRVPISRTLRAAQEDGEAEKLSWSEYMAGVLNYLTKRLNVMNDQFEHVHAHKGALKSVLTAFEAVMATNVDAQKASSPTKLSPSKESQRGLKPLRLVQANLSENQDPVVQLLKQLDVRIAEGDVHTRLAEHLSSAVRNQEEKLSSFSATTERNVADQIAHSLVNVESDSQALIGVAFGPSKHGTVTLVDRRMQESIDQLEEKTQRTGDEMRSLDVEDISRSLHDRQQAVLAKFKK